MSQVKACCGLKVMVDNDRKAERNFFDCSVELSIPPLVRSHTIGFIQSIINAQVRSCNADLTITMLIWHGARLKHMRGLFLVRLVVALGYLPIRSQVAYSVFTSALVNIS